MTGIIEALEALRYNSIGNQWVSVSGFNAGIDQAIKTVQSHDHAWDTARREFERTPALSEEEHLVTNVAPLHRWKDPVDEQPSTVDAQWIVEAIDTLRAALDTSGSSPLWVTDAHIHAYMVAYDLSMASSYDAGRPYSAAHEIAHRAGLAAINAAVAATQAGGE